MQSTNRIVPLQITIENGIIPSVEEIEQEAGRKIASESQIEIQGNEARAICYFKVCTCVFSRFKLTQSTGCSIYFRTPHFQS